MKPISEIFQKKPKTFSFELFPPKTEEGFQKLRQTVTQLATLKPDFMSVTYGAGGGSRKRTFEIVQHIEQEHHITGLAHLTCVLHTKEDIRIIVEDIKSRGIRNILALRGDPPKDNPHWQPTNDNFRYSSELCRFIRQSHGQHFSIGVAGFPEGHVLCPDRDRDAQYLKAKIDAGADFVITQLFFDNKVYFDYVKRLKLLGVTNRILPGIIPITDYAGIVKFCKTCGASVPQKIHDIFGPLQDDKEKTLAAEIKFCIEQCRDLLVNGAPGIHFYVLNKFHPVDVILPAIRK